MATPGLQHQSRRRLPQAPNIDTSVTSGEIRQRRSFVDMEQKQNMASMTKKRLTPEVVAMLLSLDYSSEITNTSTRATSGISDKSFEEICQISQTSNAKLTLQGDVGLVSIVKISGQPLGFSLREYNANKYEEPGGIFVSRLTPGGVVEKNSLLSSGDEILEINRVAVKDYKLSDVVAMIQIPKKLTLKVRFRRRGESRDISKEQGIEKPKQNVRNLNNNYIDNDQSHNQRVDNQRTGPKQAIQSTVTPPGALKFRRSSSGRLLPVLPESEIGKSHLVGRPEGPSNPHVSHTVTSNELSGAKYSIGSSDLSRTEYPIGSKELSLAKSPNAQLASYSGLNIDNNLCQRVSKTHLNKEVIKNRLKPDHEFPASKQKSQKRSTVMPVSVNEEERSQGTDSQDGRHTLKRLDPGDIKFELIASRDSKCSNLKSALVNTATRTLDETKLQSKESDKSKYALRKTSETFGSSSSLSSTDSPKSEMRKSKNSSSSLGINGLSRSEILAHSSHLSDNSPVSSSAESEDQMSKVISEKQNQKPPYLHSLSSDDLSQSHNSWFSKIGHQKRKHARKFSEGARPLSKPAAFVAPYRVQESTDVASDDVEHGYRLYPGTPQENHTRPVTGMLTLDIVKGAQIGESITTEKRKKTKVVCSVECDGVRQASTVPKKGLNDFEWNENFEIELQRTREIRINVCSRSKKEDVKIAEGCLSLATLLNEGSEHLLAVCLEPSGMICVKLKFTDMKFLLQRTPSQKKEGVFGFPLETVLRREASRIPNLIRKCVEEINKRGLETTGIYRICGNAAKKKVLRAQFENNSESVNLSQTENPVDVNIITGLLKDYLRELPQPLLSQDIRELLCEIKPEAVPDNLVSEIVKKFPGPTKMTIMYLLDHFVTVLLNSDANKMDSHNLAVCIGPVLLCPSLGGSAISTVNDTKKDISAIKLLLEIWPKPEQVSAC